MTDKPDVTTAYALRSKSDVTRLYETWADTYDETFVEAQGYQMPREIAEAFVAAGGTGPVLDVGAGTGAGGQALSARGVIDIDGIDLSPDMLRVAGGKHVYRHLAEADITLPLLGLGPYNGIVSAGTFTFGHVGPEGLPALLDVAAPGCLFTLGVNAEHYAQAGFEAAIDALSDRIEDVSFHDVRIYDDRADPDHRDDLARILMFRAK